MNVNNILQLIEQAEVEWKPLGEVAELERGKTITAKSATVGNIPVISGGQKPAYFTGDFNRNGEIITVAGSGAYAGFVMYWNEPIFVSDAFSVKPNENLLLTKYVYHFLLSNQMKIFGMKKGSGVPHVYPKDVATLQIPIPPISLQKEIVKILDKLTELKATLKAELSLREKQYQYYRDLLLTFENGELGSLATASDSERQRRAVVVWKTLGEVAERIYSGGTPKTDISQYWENGDIPWMSSGEVNLGTVYATEKFITELGLKNSNAKFVPKNSVVIALAGQGKTRGKVARIRLDLTTNQSLAAIVFDEQKINPDYVFHFLNTQYENLRQISSGNGTRGGLNLQMISSYKIPIPPLETQAKIVEILDKFDTLTQSISDGLPREIELREKQYQYYREKLLNFPQ
ncbi:restriction endonuclease subunit S [Pasteurellaceae bacterium 22721_9_1]